MTRGQAAVLLLLVVPLLWLLLWWGWRGRARRTVLTASLPTVPDDAGAARFGPVEATYVSTTRAGDWLDRVAAQGLGVRSAARVGVHSAGVLVARQGAPDLWLPAERIVGVRRDRGMAGKFADAEGVVVVTWRLGDDELDTGLRTRFGRDRQPLVDAVTSLLPHEETTR